MSAFANTLAILTGSSGWLIGWGVGLLVKHQPLIRSRWRCWRSGIRREDAIAAAEAARLANDLRLTQTLIDRYVLGCCANCVKRNINHATLRWATLEPGQPASLWHTWSEFIIAKIAYNDRRFFSVGLCRVCFHLAKPLQGWRPIEIVHRGTPDLRCHSTESIKIK